MGSCQKFAVFVIPKAKGTLGACQCWSPSGRQQVLIAAVLLCMANAISSSVEVVRKEAKGELSTVYTLYLEWSQQRNATLSQFQNHSKINVCIKQHMLKVRLRRHVLSAVLSQNTIRSRYTLMLMDFGSGPLLLFLAPLGSVMQHHLTNLTV